MPKTGQVLAYQEPTGKIIRTDSAIEKNSTVTSSFDPMLAKLIVHRKDRKKAIKRARKDAFFWGADC